jgi:microcystin degradation protein MlrC
MKVAIGGISNEANSFAPKVDMDWIRLKGYYKRHEIFDNYANTSSAPGGMIDTCRLFGVELIPTVYASVGACGVIKEEAYDIVVNDLLTATKNAGKLDGFLATLHGGGIAEKHDDLEGDILKAVRETVGEDTIIGTTLDYHGKISKEQVETADLLNGYDHFPHTDSYDKGVELVVNMISTINGNIKPTMALRKPDLLPNLQGEYSGRTPMTRVLEKVYKIEENDKVIFATVNGGFPYCDVKDAGFSVVVTTDNDMDLAEETADEISELVWDLKEDFFPECLSVKDAVKEAIRWAEHEETYNMKPVILTDVGDSAGSGSYNDGVTLFREMLNNELKNAVFGAIRAADAVEKAIKAGVGSKVKVQIGGNTSESMEVSGTVKSITDGEYTGAPRLGETKPAPLRKMGKTVVLKCDNMLLVLTELPIQISALEGFRSVGVEPTKMKYIGIKSPAHFRGAFEPIAKKIIEVDTPGLSNIHLENFNWKNIRRPIYPLDNF